MIRGLMLVAGADPAHWFIVRNAVANTWATAFSVDLRGTLEMIDRDEPAVLVIGSELIDAPAERCVARVREHAPDLPVVVIGHESPPGSADPRVAYLPIRFAPGQLTDAVRGVLADAAVAEDDGCPSLVLGESDAMRRAVDTIDRIADVDVNVLLYGETGCGKELLARRLHAKSTRSAGPFRAVCSPAVPRELFESILFGHERGAFTGATARSPGAFGQAEGGTLFLDEISSLPIDCQPKLLRAIQQREIERVGAQRLVPCNVRIVAATNVDLPAAVAAGAFREDLYHRLSVVTVEIPPLRERPEDIPALVEFFLHKYAREFRRDLPAVDPAALDELVQHRWSGNIRELENTVQRALLLATSPTLRARDFFASGCDTAAHPPGVTFTGCRCSLADVEQAYVEHVMAHTDGNQSRAAEILAIDRKTLRARLRRGTNPPGYLRATPLAPVRSSDDDDAKAVAK